MILSVITINYNNLSGLKKTIKSVLSQEHLYFEFIIIDGGSTDGSKDEILKNIDNIDYWVSEPDKGIYNAMNKGIDVANGEYCIFMNSGDVFHSSDVLKKFNEKAIDSDIICGDTLIMNCNKEFKKAPESITLDYLFSNALCHQSVFIRTALMKKYHYDETLKIVSDRKFFLQTLIISGCSYSAIDIIVSDYDIYGFSAHNRDKSNDEYSKVLNELIPKRILQDYGKRQLGQLYGESDYEKFFLETKNRKYSKLVYSLSVAIIKLISIFRDSAKYAKKYKLYY